MSIRVRAIGVGVLGVVFAAEGAAAEAPPVKKPLTHETLWMMPRVGPAVVSPDGRVAVFSVVEPDYDPDKAVSDLWAVPTDGSAPPRRITHTKAPESGVSWSPDSAAIAFATKREGDEAEEVYVLNLRDGGEAQRVTTVSTGARNPKWRPDGKAILFESMVHPGALDDEANKKAAADKKAEKFKVRVYDHYPVRYWNEWLDDRQPTVMTQDLAPGSKARDILSPTRLAQTPGFSGLEGETSISLSPIWSPDGREVVFIATVERWNAASGHVGYQLYRTDAAGGEPRPAAALKGMVSDPMFSPDGGRLFFKYAPQNQEVYNLDHLMGLDWARGGAPMALAPGFDREIAAYAPTADGAALYLLVPEAEKENLYRTPTTGGTPVKVKEPEEGGFTSLSIAQKASTPVLIAAYGSSTSPTEIVRIATDSGAVRPLSAVDTAAAAAIDWRPPLRFTFTSRGGRSIHSLVVLPPAFDAKKTYPLVVLMHGGPAASNADQIGLRWNPHLLAARGFVVLMTDYTGSTGHGEAFARAIKLDPLKTPADEINQAMDEALRRYPFIDKSRACAAGASYGGHLANWMEATAGSRYRCIVSHAGEVDLFTQWGESDGNYGRELMTGGPPWEGGSLWRSQSPATYAADWKTPILLSIGERDFRVPLGNTLENWAILQHQHVESRLLVWPDAWHWITKPEDSRRFYQEVGDWLSGHLK